jgi:hypothetical protein
MYSGKIVFAQIMDFLPMYEFQKCVKRYQGNYKIRNFSCFDQFLSMGFAQLTHRESLRSIEVSLNCIESKVYHMGIRGKVARMNLARANEKRDWRIYAEFAQILIHTARDLYTNEDFGVELDNTVYALDATTVDLCLSLFPWARFRKTKAGIKLHTLIDLRGNIPTFIDITSALVNDVNVLDILIVEPGSYYVMNRGYVDFTRFYRMHQDRAFFLTRAKKNIKFKRVYSRKVDKSTGLRLDQTIVLTDSYNKYPAHLRRVRFFDAENKRMLTFLTNDFSSPALTIAQLYKCRWQIELFFKWIKQHLRIKAFFGTSENAVKTQIWIAICIYVLVAIIKKRLNVQHSLYTILQVLSISSFEKIPLVDLLAMPSIQHTASQQKQLSFDWD